MSQSPGEDLPNDPEAPGPRHGKHAKPAPASSQDSADSAAPSEPSAADETESPEPPSPEPAPEPEAAAPEPEAAAPEPEPDETEAAPPAEDEPTQAEAEPEAALSDEAVEEEQPGQEPPADETSPAATDHAETGPAETGPAETAAPETPQDDAAEPAEPASQEPAPEPAPQQAQAAPDRPSPAAPPPVAAQPAWDALPPTATRQQPIPAMPQAAAPERRDEDSADEGEAGRDSASAAPPPAPAPAPPAAQPEPVARRSSETVQFEPPAAPETSAKTTQEERRDDWFQPRTRPEPPEAQPPAPRHARPQPQTPVQPPQPTPAQAPQPTQAAPPQAPRPAQPTRPAGSPPQGFTPDQGQRRRGPQQPAPGQPQAYQQTPRPAQGPPQAYQQPQGPDQGQARQPWDQPQRIAPPRPPAQPPGADTQVTRPNPQPSPDTRPGSARYQPSTWQQPRDDAGWREAEPQPAAHLEAAVPWTDWNDGGQQAVALREHQHWDQRHWEPQQAEDQPHAEPARRRSRGKLLAIVGGALVVLLAAVVGGQLMRPVPEPKVKLTLMSSHTFAGQSPNLPWPNNTGQAAIDVAGIGTMGTMGAETPTPTASVAKVMTAYIFLKDHPLAEGQDGPTFTISAAEASRLKWRQQRQESLVIVKAGQQFTERQALEALLVVSANNVAHEIARWEAGGDAQFVARMNDTARRLGMTHTTYTDPSGFDATTVSTATDQVKLLSAVMAIPAFAETAGQQVLNIPNNPTRYATNALLGVDGVVAGKTGWTTAAGGNFVFAARRQVGGTQVLVVGAVMGQKGVPNSEVTVDSSKPLIEAAEQALTAATLVNRGAVVGEVNDGLGGTTPLVAGKDVSAVGWPGLTVRLNLAGSAKAPRQAPEGRQLGAISLGGGQGAPQVPITLARSLGSPGYLPRLTRLA